MFFFNQLQSFYHFEEIKYLKFDKIYSSDGKL